MTEGKPLPAWDPASDSHSLGPAEETFKKRAKEVSAIEQHSHQLLCAARSTLGVTYVITPAPDTQPSLCGSVLCHPP